MRDYYIDLGFADVRRGFYEILTLDMEGIPIYPYASGPAYNIAFICHYALYHYSRYVKFKQPNDLDIFMHMSNWIIEHGEETSESFLFPNKFRWYELSPPWISALGQGRIISVLARAYEFSKDDKFIKLARKAMKPFEVPVTQGGVQAHFPDGCVAFEEYPFFKPNIVLNGLITALVGLYDLGETGEHRAAELFTQGLRALECNLHRYDLGYWSAYDLAGPFRKVSSENYHKYHIMQLWALYEMTGVEIFKKYSSKWEGYLNNPFYRIARILPRGLELCYRLTHSPRENRKLFYRKIFSLLRKPLSRK